MTTQALHPIEASPLHARRERVFLVLAGFFLGSMTMLNILGVTHFLKFAVLGIEMPLAVGVLPYPLTFLCTDFISEIYGKKRANFVVWLGLALNLWLMFILWVGGLQKPETGPEPIFFRIRELTLGSTVASMAAYLAAQFCDVHLFHFWKKLTRGKHLWLRNNGSTMVSQFVDTFCVITIAHFYAGALPIDQQQEIWPQLWTFIASGYTFKFVCALLDTLPFYLGVFWLRRYLEIDPAQDPDGAGFTSATSLNPPSPS